MAVTNKLGIWGGDYGASWSSASGGVTPGFNANTLNYATKMNQAFKAATILPYTFAQILAEASIPSVSINIDPSNFSMNESDISAFVSDMRSAINYYICSRAGKIASANYAFNAGSATTANAFSTARTINLTGDITGSVDSDGTNGWTINTTITDGSVTSTKLGQSAVTSVKISSGAVTNNKLANPSIVLKNGTNGTNKTITLGSNATELSTIFGFVGFTELVQFNSSTKAFTSITESTDKYMGIIPNNYTSGNQLISSANYLFASYVGRNAFMQCSNLETVSFSSSVYFGAYAFKSCTKLSKITAPYATGIENEAIDGKTQSLILDIRSAQSLRGMGSNSNPGSPWFNAGLLKECYIDNLRVVYPRMFEEQTFLSTIGTGGTDPDISPRISNIINCSFLTIMPHITTMTQRQKTTR